MAGTYKITSKLSGKCLNVYGNNVTSISNHQNVCVWSNSGSNEQKWVISSLTAAGVAVRTFIDTTYGLNAYRSGSPWNCDLYKILGNESDANVNLIATNGYYKIQLWAHTSYYLTAGGTADGSNVYWTTATGGDNQLWAIDPISTSTTEKTLSMPQNLNQKYQYNDACIKSAGCCVCSVGDIAAYYHGGAYSFKAMKADGVYSSSDATCYWNNARYASFSNITLSSQSAYLTRIKSEIDANRPVAVYMTGTYNHWVVAYGYTNSASGTSYIKVLDPYNSDTSTTVGRAITLSQAMSDQGASTISGLLISAAK